MLIPLLHILLAVITIFGFAVLASALARKAGINLKEIAGRNAPQLLWIGAAANLGALLLYGFAMLMTILLIYGLPMGLA